MREFHEDWSFIDLSLLPRCMDWDEYAHNHWFLIAQTQNIGMALVAASEDNTSDKNGKPSTALYLISSTSTIITTRYNLRLANNTWGAYLPHDQHFCFSLKRTAFFATSSFILLFRYNRTRFVSMFHFFSNFFIPMGSQRLIFSRLAGAKFANYITCLTTQRICFPTHYHVFTILHMFQFYYVLFICIFSIPVCSHRLRRASH